VFVSGAVYIVFVQHTIREKMLPAIKCENPTTVPP